MDTESPLPATTVRRNPPRRAKQIPSIKALDLSTSSSTVAADDLRQKPADGSENLKVFLRIRPLEIRPKPAKDPIARPRAKPRASSPKGVKGKSSKNACLAVNDSSSVTLTAPPSVFDSKRTKSELYDGFSFVFPQASVQEDIYEKVMNPLLMDFMGGKSALLAAMGPTGSGKTHTMFGSPREPGIVPLALRHIFDQSMEHGNHHLLRSYHISMFEIYSERGKGERIIDLSCDGGDLSFQQSTIKGLQEIRVSDATKAESLVACGLLKRSTAATNANSQSSRSQCIINIRWSLEGICDKNDLSTHGAILTIADLAGAERERKTGNQGSRLLESNFINNTSMVFGLCLRSLLEHQKNRKKLLEKHFKNSLLTRYLREYLEGKKRMTLILTVKPGEHDYLDTSFLLRQASPFMKIKFNNLDDVPSLLHPKRNATSLFRTDDQKRRKFNDSEAEMVHARSDVCGGLEKEIEARHTSNMSSESPNTEHFDAKLNRELQVELARIKRNDEVMRKFSKALWSILKQYKDKLEESENEVHCLKETLGKESHQVMELKNELRELRSHCSCHKHSSDEENSRPKVHDRFSLSSNEPAIPSPEPVDPKNADAALVYNITPMPICQSPETSALTVNDSEDLGLKGILLDGDITGDSKSAFRFLVERRSFVLERQKISTYKDDVHSNLPSGGLEVQSHQDIPVDQIDESLPEVEHPHEHFESASLSNCSVKIPSDLDSAEAAYEDATKDYSPEYTLSKEDKKLVTSVAVGSCSNVGDGSTSEHIQQDCQRFPGNGHCSGHLVEMDSCRVTGRCGRSSRGGIEHSDVIAMSDQTENCAHSLSSLDGYSTLLLEKAGSSDTAYSLLSVGVTADLIDEEESFQGSKHISEDDEGFKGGENDSLHHSNLTEEVERGMVHEQESNLKVIEPELKVSLVEDIKEIDKSQLQQLPKKGKHASSTKSLKTEKPKRRLLPASALLLKEFSGLDMESEDTKECRGKVTAVGRGRSQGSMSLVRLLTSKQ